MTALRASDALTLHEPLRGVVEEAGAAVLRETRRMRIYTFGRLDVTEVTDGDDEAPAATLANLQLFPRRDPDAPEDAARLRWVVREVWCLPTGDGGTEDDSEEHYEGTLAGACTRMVCLLVERDVAENFEMVSFNLTG